MNNKKISILGSPYTVKLKNGIVWNNRPAFGLCDYENRIIYIDGNLSRQDMEWTLVHEVGHATWRRSGFFQNVSHEMEELIVDALFKPIIEHCSLRFRKKPIILD